MEKLKKQREERLKEQMAAREEREIVDREKEMEMNDELTRKEDEALFSPPMHPSHLNFLLWSIFEYSFGSYTFLASSI